MVDHLRLLVAESPEEGLQLFASDDVDGLYELLFDIALLVPLDYGGLHVVHILLL